MYVKSKSTVSESVSELVTRSPIELFWTAKKQKREKGRERDKGRQANLFVTVSAPILLFRSINHQQDGRWTSPFSKSANNLKVVGLT